LGRGILPACVPVFDTIAGKRRSRAATDHTTTSFIREPVYPKRDAAVDHAVNTAIESSCRPQAPTRNPIQIVLEIGAYLWLAVFSRCCLWDDSYLRLKNGL
jgi:hypothetical protein